MPAAAGVTVATLNRKGGDSKMVVRVRGGELASLLGQANLQVRVTLGDGPAIDCVASSELPCSSSGSSVRCRR